MIAVDWGSSSLRAFRLDASGDVRDARRSEHGVLRSEGRFREVLERFIDGWDDERVVMAGMIGSRQGWMEIPYVQCPADAERIAASMQRLPDDAWPGREAWIVPGLSTHEHPDAPDVMRGEETQICGLLPALGSGVHVVLLPGTHSKHAHVRDGRIESFRTFMTGEVFDLLRHHGVLGRLMQGDAHDKAAFAEGVTLGGKDGELLHQIFSVRTRGLFDQIAPQRLSSYLSGILVGHELRALPGDIAHVHVVCGDALAAPYLSALRMRGVAATHHGEALSARGLHVLAQARGLSG